MQPRFRRFAYGLAGNLDDADDLLQAAYLRAFDNLHQWRPGTRLDSWMYRIMQSIQINRYHAERVRGAGSQRVDPDTQVGTDGERETEAKLTLAAVRKFIGQMPDEQRTVILLIAVEGLSYKEAAETLGLPIGTVTSRLARARMALADHVDGKGLALGPQRMKTNGSDDENR